MSGIENGWEEESPEEPDEISEDSVLPNEELTTREIHEEIRKNLGGETSRTPEIPLEDLEELQQFLSLLRVEGLDNVTQHDIQELWLKFKKDPYLVEDFILIVTDRLRLVRQTFATTISFDEINQYSQATPRPEQTRKLFLEGYAQNILQFNLKLLDRKVFYQKAQSEKRPINARAARFLGWLIGQYEMEEFPHTVIQASSERDLNLQNIAALATREVIDRQTQHAIRRETAYAIKVPAEQEAFEYKSKILQIHRDLCEAFLLGRPSQT